MSEMIAISLSEYMNLTKRDLALTAIENALADDVGEKNRIPYSVSVRTDILKYANPSLYARLEVQCTGNSVLDKLNQEKEERKLFEAYKREHDDETTRKSYL